MSSPSFAALVLPPSQVWKLSATDLCEVARNSVLHSGFPHQVGWGACNAGWDVMAMCRMLPSCGAGWMCAAV